MSKETKTRVRRVFSCSNCRVKKRRCDRQLPCGECTRQGLYDTCVFEGVKPYAAGPALTAQFPQSDRSGGPGGWKPPANCPEDPNGGNGSEEPPPKDWEFNFFEALNKKEDGSIEASLIGYSTLPGAEPFTKVMREVINRQKTRVWDVLVTRDGLVSENVRKEAEHEAASRLGPKYIRQLTASSTEDEYNAVRQAINASSTQFGLYYCPFGSWVKLTAKERVQAMLPPHRVLIPLVQVFFNFQRKWFPILNQAAFFEDLNDFIGSTIDGQCIIKRFGSKKDAAISASVLIVLRIAYTVVIHSEAECSQDIRELILNHPIPVDAVEVARDLIKIADDCDPYPLRALLLLLTAHLFCPESEWSREDNSIRGIIHRIVSMAVSLKLNMDYSKLAKWRQVHSSSQSEKDDRRMLWHTIIRLDVLCAILFEQPLRALPGSYLVDLPTKPTGDDTDSVHIFAETEAVFRELQGFINDVTPYTSELPFSELNKKIQNFEKLCADQLGGLEDYLHPLECSPGSPLKLHKFMLLICCKTWLLTLYSSLALFFEKEKESALCTEFTKRRLTIAVKEFSFLDSCLLGQLDSYFGSSSFVVLRPLIIRSAMTQLSIAGFGVRCSLNARLTSNVEPKFDALRAQHLYGIIGEGLLGMFDTFLETLEPMCEVFQHAWEIRKSSMIGRMLLGKIQLTEEDMRENGFVMRFTADELKSLNEILNDAELDRKSYKKLFGSEPKWKGTSAEDMEQRAVTALQLERKWKSVKMIHSHTMKSIFNEQAGIKPETADPQKATHAHPHFTPVGYEAFDQQYILDLLYNNDF